MSASRPLRLTIDIVPLLGCQAWEDYRPVLRFLALIRLRAEQGRLILDPTGLPVHSQLINIPAEVTHEIFAYVFAELVEDQKLVMLHELGPCSHGGWCPGPPLREWNPPDDDNLLVQKRACQAYHKGLNDDRRGHGRSGMIERRQQLLSAGDPGICFVDHLGFTTACLKCGGGRYHEQCEQNREDVGKLLREVWRAEIEKVSH